MSVINAIGLDMLLHKEYRMEIFALNAIIWLQIAILYDYQYKYPIYISLICSIIAIFIYIFKEIRSIKNGKI